MAKAYDRRTEARLPAATAADQAATIPEETHFPEYIPPYQPAFTFEAALQSIGVAEALGLLGLAYVCCVGAFNAGYFTGISGQFAQLFSFVDLLGANIALVQYGFVVVTVYCLLSVAITLVKYLLWYFGLHWAWFTRQRQNFDEFVLRSHVSAFVSWMSFLLIILISVIGMSIADTMKHRYLSIALLPVAFGQGALLFLCWRGFRAGYVTTKSFAFALVLGVLYFSFESGKAWLKYDLSNPEGVQSIMTRDDRCLDRKILRISSNGYLLYSPAIQAFEFRSKDDLKTIFDRRACI